ncbi:MAG: hypothetical protein NUW22_03975 [Acidobacteria bacterium]|nr:hypothetical protein [Acidobacteriota bacterium]
MNDDLTPVLADLPEPPVPEGFAATVMARIARETEQEVAVGVASAERAAIPAYLWALVGVALVVGAGVYGWYDAGALPDLTSARIGLGRAVALPLQGPALMLCGVGLLLYLAGLLAPLGRRR